MPFRDIKGSFIKLSKDGINPKEIPEHYGVYYAKAYKMYQNFSHFGGLRDIQHNYWPIICLLADQQKQIDELCARLAEMDTEPGPAVAGLEAPKQRGRPRKLQPIGA